jgi:hypothetical protein
MMKLTKNDIDKKAERITFDLICTCGLKNAKKVAMQIRRNLKAEEVKRK